MRSLSVCVCLIAACVTAALADVNVSSPAGGVTTSSPVSFAGTASTTTCSMRPVAARSFMSIFRAERFCRRRDRRPAKYSKRDKSKFGEKTSRLAKLRGSSCRQPAHATPITRRLSSATTSVPRGCFVPQPLPLPPIGEYGAMRRDRRSLECSRLLGDLQKCYA